MAEACKAMLTITAGTAAPSDAAFLKALQKRLDMALRIWTMSEKLTTPPVTTRASEGRSTPPTPRWRRGA
jgi:hypothetical protein